MEVETNTDVKTTSDEKQLPPEEPERINFKCSSCSMTEQVDYFGRNPPVTRNIEFAEDCYVMKDPFTAPPTKHGNRSFTEFFIVLGSHCSMCELIVCKDCSLFFKNNFCYSCAYSEIKQFPLEIQSKIRKEMLAIKNS